MLALKKTSGVINLNLTPGCGILLEMHGLKETPGIINLSLTPGSNITRDARVLQNIGYG